MSRAGPIDAIFDDIEQTAAVAGWVGCTDAELDGLGEALGGVLPSLYRRYMLIAGRSKGPAPVGTDSRYPTVLALRGWAEELLAESRATYTLPDDLFVFAMHQGYAFTAMWLGRGDDPRSSSSSRATTRPPKSGRTSRPI